MKKPLLFVLVLTALAVYLSYPAAPTAISSTPTATTTPPAMWLSVTPEEPMQGEPFLVRVDGATSLVEVEKLTFNGKALPIFMMGGEVVSLAGLDLRQATGTYSVHAVLSDGRTLSEDVVVKARKIETAPLGIPETLGGNTPESEKELVSTLVEEGKIISAIPVTDEKLWSESFSYPLATPVVTDAYGYSRETGATTIAHKGTDFRAAVGTRVSAINVGKVAYTGFLRNYGNVIAIDHGARVLSIYMHLSKISVAVGQSVVRGETLGFSGDTGYVLGAHLHLTIRIGGISVDPLAFLKLLGPDASVPLAKTVVAFGDSLTYGIGSTGGGGYVSILADELGMPIRNLGVSGNTTTQALARLPEATAEKASVAIVLLGGNDFLQGVPAATTFKNLAAIIEGFKKAGTKVLLLGLTSEVAGNRDREYFDALAREEGVAYIPDILRDIYGVPAMMSDALHPNDAGYALMASRIAPVLKNMMK